MESAAEYRETLGVVLAGGQSTRMGGGDKGLRLLAGRSILERIVSRLAPQTAGVVVSANGDPRRLAALGLPVIPDGPCGLIGPLAGVLAGLAHAAQLGVPWVVSVPSDAPFLPSDLVALLHRARRQSGAPGAVAVSSGKVHPTVCLWPVSSLADLEEAVLVQGMRRARDAVSRLRLAQAEWTDGLDPFVNINTPEDLTAAEALLATLEGRS